MTPDSSEGAVLTAERLSEMSRERLESLDGIVVDDDGRPRFTIEMFDNTGRGSHEE